MLRTFFKRTDCYRLTVRPLYSRLTLTKTKCERENNFNPVDKKNIMEISILPRWMIRYLAKDYLRQNDINILLSNLIIISTFILFKNTLIDFLNLIPHICLVDKFFSVECPVCGTTRAFCELSKGNINNAISFNYTSLFVASFFILQIPLRLFSLTKENTHKRVNLLSKYLGNIILIIILTSWVIKLFIKN